MIRPSGDLIQTFLTGAERGGGNMHVRAIVRSIVVGLVLVLGLVLWASCGSDSNNGGGVGPDGGIVGPMDDGLCRPTCTKDCIVDQDCEVSQGELCCDLGPR